MRGQVVKEHFVSQVLSSNPLGDPAERDLLVYLPPGYERSLSQRYPVVFALAGYSESDASLQNWLPFQPTLSDRLDLLTEGQFGDIVDGLGTVNKTNTPGNTSAMMTGDLVGKIDAASVAEVADAGEPMSVIFYVSDVGDGIVDSVVQLNSIKSDP